MEQPATDESNGNAAPPAAEEGNVFHVPDGDQSPRYPVEIDSEQNNHSLPTPMEVHSRPSEGKCNLLLIASIVILAIAAVVGLAVGLTWDGADSSSKSSSSEVLNPPSQASKNNDRLLQIQKYLTDNEVSAASDFGASRTPQSEALGWIASSDEAQLGVPSGGLGTSDGYNFATRYALAVLYYSTGGANWNYQLLFLSEHDICQWFYVFEYPIGTVGVLCDQTTKQIQGISFIFNDLTGSLPKELGVLNTLTYVESIGNLIGGTIPDSYRRLRNMRTFVLPHNRLSGKVPAWIAEWTELRYLYLSNNEMTGAVPPTISELDKLIVLGLDDNDFTGSFEWLWSLESLKIAYMEDNRFSGNFQPSILDSASSLEVLDMSDNKITGALPTDIFDLPSLRVLDLHGNTITNALPSPSADNTKLQFLALHRNQLSSVIPTTIGRLKAVTHLDLSYNQFVGNPTGEIGEMAGLTYLFLAENPFEDGEIPFWTYSLEELRELSWKNTNRTSDIGGNSLALLTKLVMLDLDNNKLTGSIPTTIGSLTALQFLLLNRNEGINGEIPVEMELLTNLRFLFLDKTSVSGDMANLCALPTLGLVFADEGEVTCECCTLCTDGGGPCNDNAFASNLDPLWESGYEREDVYSFKNGTN